MKKLLALVLALVMSMSLVTISNAAFSDAADIDYKEAVDVLAAVGVLEGSDGKFDPKAELTREQAAKIIAYLDLGKSTAEALPAVKVFNDVEASRWSAKFVAYCADAGYINGVGNGNFDPTGKLTGYAFGKLLLCALGYDATIEEMTGASWTIKVAKLMESNSLTKGTSKLGSAVLTREEAAQYALNALKATMVEYDEKGSTITAGDVTIVTGAKKAQAVTTEESYGKAIKTEYQANGTTPVTKQSVQLGEKLYKGDLTLAATGAATSDDFGRPVKTWQYKNDDVASSASDAAATFTAKTKAADVAKALKGYKFNGTELKDKDTKIGSNYSSAIGTVLTFSSADDKIAEKIETLTANGKVVEFYATGSDDKAIDKIVVIEYTVTKFTGTSTNAAGDVTYKFDVLGSRVDYADENKTDTIKVMGTLTKDEYVTYVTPAGSGKPTYVYPTTKFEGTQTSFNTNKNTIVVSGTTYGVANGVKKDASHNVAVSDFATSDKAANYYVDQFGFVVKTDAVATETKYLVVSAIAKVQGLSDEIQANVIFADGTTDTVKVSKAVNESAEDKTSAIETSAGSTTAASFKNVVCTYKIDSKGKYEITAVKTETGSSAAVETWNEAKDVTKKGSPVVEAYSTIAVDNATVFVVKTGTGSDVKYTVYTGYANVPSISAANSKTVAIDYAMKDGAVKFVYIDASAAASVTADSSSGTIVYILDTDYSTSGKSDEQTYTYNAVVDGKKTPITTSTTKDSGGSNDLAVGLYKVTATDKDGNAKTLVKQSAGNGSGDDFKAVTTFTSSTDTDAKNGVVKIAGITYIYDGGETVYVIDADSNVSEGTVESLSLGTNAADYAAVYVKKVSNNTTANEIEVMYIVMK